MIVAMRYWAAVASRSRTRGRSIGRKTPPRSGRPSALTLRITALKPTPPAQGTPSVPSRPRRSGANLSRSWPFGIGDRQCRPGPLAPFARDQAQVAAGLEALVAVDAAERLLADLAGELAALAHRGLELAEGALEVVALERRDLLLEPVDVAAEPALQLAAHVALDLQDAAEQRVELLHGRQPEGGAGRLRRRRGRRPNRARLAARAGRVEGRIEPDDRLDALRSFG